MPLSSRSAFGVERAGDTVMCRDHWRKPMADGVGEHQGPLNGLRILWGRAHGEALLHGDQNRRRKGKQSPRQRNPPGNPPGNPPQVALQAPKLLDVEILVGDAAEMELQFQKDYKCVLRGKWVAGASYNRRHEAFWKCLVQRSTVCRSATNRPPP